MTVRFRLLGEIEVLLDGRRLDAGHARQRCVLAALLVEVNRPVPVDQLIDRVWADRPPYRARNALSAYVSRLRQLLAGVPGVRIGREAGGLCADGRPAGGGPARFRHLVRPRPGRPPARGRGGAVRAGAGPVARGAASPRSTPRGSTMSAPSCRPSGSRSCWTATTRRCGPAGTPTLLVELADAARAHPLDERLAGQLMLAQYRSGRQADALDTYQEMRDAAASTSWVPTRDRRCGGCTSRSSTGDAAAPASRSPPRRRGRRGQPAPARAGRRRAAGPPTCPGARPASSAAAGRSSGVAAALRRGPLVTLIGVGGVGKSRLAVEVAAPRPGPVPPTARGCASWRRSADGGPVGRRAGGGAAGAAAARADHRADRGRVPAGRELLLVLDNCEHVLDAGGPAGRPGGAALPAR